MIAAIGNSLNEGDSTPPLDGPTVETPTPLLGMSVTCPTRGAGFRVRLQWPSIHPTPAPVAYELASLTPGIDFDTELWTRRYTSPPSVGGVPPATEVKVIAQAIAADGTRFTPTASLVTTPDAPC